MDNKKISLKKVLITILAIFVIWVIVGTVDYLRVASFEKPIFSIPFLQLMMVVLVHIKVLDILLKLKGIPCRKMSY